MKGSSSVIQNNKNWFAFRLNDLGVMKGQDVCIDIIEDAPIF